jgi:DNA-binding winged helix-turn-helix (wHTH) protein/tetratricopeptide (TPR) repeat protein/TolB-like protein
MGIPASEPKIARFGVFEVDLAGGLLTRQGRRVRIGSQPFQVLALLLARPGEIVTREELRQELWPNGTFVDFDGSLNSALKKLRAALDDNPKAPNFIETVPRRGYRFIVPIGVVNSPTKGALDAAGEEGLAAFASEIVQPRNPWLRRQAVAFATFLLLAVPGFLILTHRGSLPQLIHGQSTAQTVPRRRSLAVLEFHNASGRSDEAWFSTALAEMLRTELGAADKLRVVPGEAVEEIRLASPWSGTDSLTPETTSRIGKALSSDLLVLGSYEVLGKPRTETVRVDFRLQNARTGEILYAGSETGSSGRFFGLVASIGAVLRHRLGLPLVQESEEADVLSSLPADPEAVRIYTLGLQRMREYDLVTARDLFLQAEKIAPDFPSVHLMLAQAWRALGFDPKARTEAKKAFDLSANLPPAEKLLIEGVYYETVKEGDKAASAYRALYALHPDSVDDAERLIVVLNAAGRREEALAVVKQLRGLAPPTSEDPRIDFWEAKLISYTNARAARPLLDKAVAESETRGQKLLYARFRLEQCLGLVYSDHPQAARASCEEAYRIFLSTGNRLMAADALRIMGDRRGSQGDFDGAVDSYKQALAMLHTLSEHEKTGAVLNNMAVAVENQGRIAQSEVLFQEARRNFEECGDALNAAVAVGNIGDILMAQGNLQGAEKKYDAARDMLRTVNPAGIGYVLSSLAQVRLLEGDIARARHYANQALEVVRKKGDPMATSQAEALLGDVFMAGGDLPAARQEYQSALEVRKNLGDKSIMAQSRAELAVVSMEEGKPSEAEAALRDSLVEFQSEKAAPNEIQTETDFARLLLMQKKLGNARKVISQAAVMSRTSHDPALTLPVAIQDARVKIALLASARGSKPDISDPDQELQRVIFAAKRLGYYGIECDARLALGELELRVTPAAGRAHLRMLAEESHLRGMNLISRKAEELLKP